MSDDTAYLQNCADTNTDVGHGIFYTNSTIIVGGNHRLRGQGVRGSNDPNPIILGTMILPGPSFPIGNPIVWVQNGTSRVEDLQIGYWRMPRLAEIGLSVGNMADPIDRVLIRNVAITGSFGVSFLSARAVSSRMDFVQIWQFQAGACAAQFENSSTWTNTGCEVHLDAAANGAAPLNMTGGSFCVGFFGGNISTALGNPTTYVLGSGYYFSPTTFLYQESP